MLLIKKVAADRNDSAVAMALVQKSFCRQGHFSDIISLVPAELSVVFIVFATKSSMALES